MKPADIQVSPYIEYGVGNNDKDPKFKVGDHLILKYENIFARDTLGIGLVSLCDQAKIF